MRATFVNTLTELARSNDKIMCVIGDTGFSVFEEFEKEFKERFVNVGIAEQNFVSFGAGLSAMGMKPYLYNVVSFMTLRALEQIELDISYQENPVVLVGVGGGHAYGTAGPTHHAYYDLTTMCMLPNMAVVCPADPVEMEAVMRVSQTYDKPLYIRIGRSIDPIVHVKPISFESYLYETRKRCSVVCNWYCSKGCGKSRGAVERTGRRRCPLQYAYHKAG